MISGDIRSKIDALWNAFWTGGISNPLEVIEQITYLLFLKRLDDLHTLEENKAARLKLKKLERRVFPDGKDDHSRNPRPYEDCRWSRFKHFAPAEMFEVVNDHVFPFLRTLGGDGSTYAHQTLRQLLVKEQKLDAVISLPGGVFKPYAGVSTAILLFTKTNSGGTDHVWFYDVDADGLSLDDKRTELLPPEKLGPVPKVALTAADHAKNNLPDILARWRSFGVSSFGVPPLGGKASELPSASKSSQPASPSRTPPPEGGTPNPELARPRTAQSFCVPKADLAAQGYDLSLNRYKEVIHAEVAHRPPGEILAALADLEKEIVHGMHELETMLAKPVPRNNLPP